MASRSARVMPWAWQMVMGAMAALSRSSRRMGVSWVWGWMVVEDATSVMLAHDTFPGSPGEERACGVIADVGVCVCMIAPFGWSLVCVGALDAGLMELYLVVLVGQAGSWVVTGFCARSMSVWGKFLNSKGLKRSEEGD